MKQFIEVEIQNGGKTLVNVDTICFLNTLKSGKVQIILTAPSANGSHFVNTNQSYEEIKALIQASL